MLTVGIDPAAVRVPAFGRLAVPAAIPARRPRFSPNERTSAPGAGDVGRRVGRAVVDDEHVRVGKLPPSSSSTAGRFASSFQAGMKTTVSAPARVEPTRASDRRLSILAHPAWCRVGATSIVTKGEPDCGGIDAKSPAIYEFVEEGSSVEQVAGGFTFTEGPIWHPRDHYLLFSDMPADIRRKYTPGTAVVEVAEPLEQVQRDDLRRRSEPDRLRARDELRRARGPGRHARDRRAGLRGRGAELPERRDRRLRRLDLLLRPVVRAVAGLRPSARARLGWQGVFRIPPAVATPELVVGRDEFEMPNGICFSPGQLALLHQRHAGRVHQGLRRQRRRLARERPHVLRGRRHRA